MYVFAAVTWLGPHFHVNTPGAATLVPVCLRLLSICTHLSLHWSRNTTTADLKWPQADQTDRRQGHFTWSDLGGVCFIQLFSVSLCFREFIFIPLTSNAMQCNGNWLQIATHFIWQSILSLEWIISPQRLITIDMMYMYIYIHIYSILWLIFSSGHLIKIFLTCVIYRQNK